MSINRHNDFFTVIIGKRSRIATGNQESIMRARGRLAYFISLLIATIGICGGAVYAASNQQTVVGGNNDSSLYKVGQTVDISGNVNGDIFCAGQIVTINA